MNMGCRETGKSMEGRSKSLQGLHGNHFTPKQGNRVTVVNPHTNKAYRMIKNANGRMTSETEVVFNMYREAVGGNFIGYRIEKQRISNICHLGAELRGLPYSHDDQDWDIIKKQGWCKIDDSKMYDEVFIIGSKSLTSTDNKMEEVLAGSLTKAKLRTVFSKSQNSSKNARMMLTELAKKIA